MLIGIPKEIKSDEYRVSITPGGVREMVLHGHRVVVETGAGVGSGFKDDEYRQAGAYILDTAAQVWEQAEMIMKVKEPLPSEFGYLRDGLILYTYLHLAAAEALTHALIESGTAGLAYETVELVDHSLPLLQPMSEVAGRMATQIAAHYLEKTHGGVGKLMGGIPGVLPARVLILGGGTVGTQAARVAAGMGADVVIMDINLQRLRDLDEVMPPNIRTRFANQAGIAEEVQRADVIIGAVLVTGARAPHLVKRDMIKSMQPGSVIVDVAVDQGGCIETTRPTTHSDPIYFVDDVLHYGVANMPGAVPRTSTFGLSNATLRYALQIADLGLEVALAQDLALQKGVNTYQRKLVYEPVAAAFGLDYSPLVI